MNEKTTLHCLLLASFCCVCLEVEKIYETKWWNSSEKVLLNAVMSLMHTGKCLRSVREMNAMVYVWHHTSHYSFNNICSQRRVIILHIRDSIHNDLRLQPSRSVNACLIQSGFRTVENVEKDGKFEVVIWKTHFGCVRFQYITLQECVYMCVWVEVYLWHQR